MKNQIRILCGACGSYYVWDIQYPPSEYTCRLNRNLPISGVPCPECGSQTVAEVAHHSAGMFNSTLEFNINSVNPHRHGLGSAAFPLPVKVKSNSQAEKRMAELAPKGGGTLAYGPCDKDTNLRCLCGGEVAAVMTYISGGPQSISQTQCTLRCNKCHEALGRSGKMDGISPDTDSAAFADAVCDSIWIKQKERCSKCGSSSINTYYSFPMRFLWWRSGEYMQNGCNNCGYDWRSPCKGARSRKATHLRPGESPTNDDLRGPEDD